VRSSGVARCCSSGTRAARLYAPRYQPRREGSSSAARVPGAADRAYLAQNGIEESSLTSVSRAERHATDGCRTWPAARAQAHAGGLSGFLRG
jgi:hypothetical protein